MTCFGNIFAYFVVDKARFSIEVMRPKVNLGLTFLVQYCVSFSYRKNMKYSLQPKNIKKIVLSLVMVHVQL